MIVLTFFPLPVTTACELGVFFMGKSLLAVFFVNLGLTKGAIGLPNGAEGLTVGSYILTVGADGLTNDEDVCDG
ncbi:hypothetical protein Tco_1183956 [Tanacetum coccineum]